MQKFMADQDSKKSERHSQAQANESYCISSTCHSWIHLITIWKLSSTLIVAAM